ncbi:MAG: methionine--tRNA ligase [Bacteroidia bacterium]
MTNDQTMSNPKRYTVTSALPYANGPLHIGHMAGAYLPADTYVRYLRLRGRDVAFICGSDEHGAAITLRAKKEGTTPKAIVDKYHAINKQAFADFGISFDIYHRTTEPIHYKTSQEIFMNLYEKGEFTEKSSEQYFDEEYQQFLADRYITGTCPNCGNENAYGDQCEKCGSTLSPLELINPVSTLSGKKPILKTTTHWYLPLDKYQPWLEEWLGTKEGEWKKNVFGQCKSWLKAGLHPRAMTRDLDWGIPVPLDSAEGKVMYVWLDAPIGYISATKDWAQQQGKNWELYWKKQENPDDNARLLHFVGKDNIVFHCIIFPSILNAHGEFIVPDNVPANEFLNLEGDKLSTSRNWAVWLHEYLEDFPGKQDVLRYVLTSIAPETKDSEFTWKDFQDRNNNELANILGNLVNRLKLLHKYYGGLVPEPTGIEDDAQAQDVFTELQKHIAEVEKNLEQFRFRDALSAYINIARLGNKYLTDTEPWKLWKTDAQAVGRILYTTVQVVGALGVLGQIFLPHAGQRILETLNMDKFGKNDWDSLSNKELVSAGTPTQMPEPIFPRFEDKVIEAQVAKLEANKAAKAQEGQAESANLEPLKDEMTFDDFLKLDIRVGTILEAEKVPKADKLLQFKVDTGIDQRTVVSGVAKHFAPEELVGKQVTLIVNLAPRKIRGVESEGMILFAEDPDGKLHLVNPEYGIPAGCVVK